MLKVSAFYLEKQKSFIPKKNIFLAVVNIKTKKLCLLTQFSGKVLVYLMQRFHYNQHVQFMEDLEIRIMTIVEHWETWLLQLVHWVF